MMTQRQLAYVLLDQNLDIIQSHISRKLENRLNNPNWKALVKDRVYSSVKNAPTELNLDYNEFPAIVRIYASTFSMSTGTNQELFRLLAKIRDERNKIAHHKPYSYEDLVNLRELFQILFNILNINSKIHETTFEPNSVQQSISSELTSAISHAEERSYFIISERLRGLGLVICTKFKRGKYAGKRFLYSHDEVFDVCFEFIKDSAYWSKYSCYTSTTSIRKEAQLFIKELA